MFNWLKTSFLILLKGYLLVSPGEICGQDFLSFLQDYVEIKYPEIQFKRYVYINVSEQTLYCIEQNRVIKSYVISTAKNGKGSQFNSEKTPEGLHEIKEKIGHNAPLFSEFENRLQTGQICSAMNKNSYSEKDRITSRILHLSGMEPGINKGSKVDTYQRNIYVHGTNEEWLLGQPASHGCIRMANKDVVELFDLVNSGTPVMIY